MDRVFKCLWIDRYLCHRPQLIKFIDRSLHLIEIDDILFIRDTLDTPYFDKCNLTWGCGGMVDATDLKSVVRYGRASSSLATPILKSDRA
jgi:hypothetical protein